MCRGDIALVPMHWQSSSPKPIADFSAPHKCVDWEALMEWSKPRFLDILRPNYLKHPVLGTPQAPETLSLRLDNAN